MGLLFAVRVVVGRRVGQVGNSPYQLRSRRHFGRYGDSTSMVKPESRARQAMALGALGLSESEARDVLLDRRDQLLSAGGGEGEAGSRRSGGPTCFSTDRLRRPARG
ncbi:hypothetical protein ACM01_30775 [Streptomyces viridochromogenes]|uniref:Uncharacterized protein n=1 Tax=Streptomyces viridochromogenes TaxID=1938 RepID=A0A0J7Z3Q1_STRVR|nr:hypothetical protein ACM01_30775 [Streptomyces viridochromogenes]KOG16782.1 hypothetical protein ADK36_26535 [Streptomyces viridochromogenes]KOG17966.1 hypothetical protein ADK35_23390 [Streptomyces viridochromogenes]